MKNLLLFLLLAVAIASCKKQPQELAGTIPQQQIDTTIKFYLESKSNPGSFDTTRIDLTLAGDSVVGVVPRISKERSFVVSFEPANASVKVGNIVQKSGVTVNDFSKPITYTFTNSKGQVKKLKVSITNFTGLPIFYLETSSEVVSEDTYVTGTFNANVNGQFDPLPSNIPMNIRGRGNGTWLAPKKPYRIKFNSKQSLLGLTAAKSWVLLANYYDKTLIRNAVALDMGHQFSADFTPHYRFVEVVMNGSYIGNYMLTEQVEVNQGRVAINELSPGDVDDAAITGGYLLEVDESLDADNYFYSNNGVPFTIKDPNAITDKQLAYIHNYIQQTEDAIFAANFADPDNGYAKYINVDSFINWYLVKELMKDNDALDKGSIYFYKDLNGKLGMGPVWDFDVAGGNDPASGANNDPTGWLVRNEKWFGRLFQDPAFKARVKERWEELQPNLALVMDNIDQNAAYINLSQQQNFAVWNIMNSDLQDVNGEIAGSYKGEVEYLKTWLRTRIQWMNANM
jgi:hypothetical protein